MSSETLVPPTETLAIFARDAALAGHSVSPLQELREHSSMQPDVEMGVADFEILPDSSALLSATAAYRGLLTLTPGDTVGIVLSLPEAAKSPQHKLLVAQQLEQVAVVLAHEALGNGHMRTHLVTAQRVDSQAQPIRWNNQNDGPTDKKADAVGALMRYFSDKGSELTQITGALFAQTVTARDEAINNIGHDSHHKPISSFGTNMLARIPGVRFAHTHIDHSEQHPQMRIRTGLVTNGEHIAPLPLTHASEERILGITLATSAVTIAQTNPLELGKGTRPEAVFDAMQTAVGRLPEHMGNGATLKQAHQSFRGSIRS